MVFIPFIYFSLLTYYWWKKHGCFDVCVYMSSLYAFTSFFSIVIILGDMLGDGGILFDDTDVELNPLPTFIYCILLTVSILPFSLIYKKEIKVIKPFPPFVADIVSWILIVVSFINLYLIIDSTADILGGDLEAVRAAHYDGLLSPAQVKAETMPFVLKYLYYLNTSTLLALPLFFYYSCFEKRSWWFKGLVLFSSFSQPLVGIQTADRAEFTLYGLMFVFCIIFFHKFFTRKMKRTLIFISIPFVVGIVTYMVAVSVARFKTTSGGAETSAVQYAGQNYINFCFFWENADPSLITAEREFPLLYHTVMNIDTDDERRGDRGGELGFFMSVFATFIGDILLDLSFPGLLIWLTYFFLLSLLVIKRSHREEFDMADIMAIFVLAVIPIFGVFYYRYFYFTYTLMLILTALLYFLTKNRLVYRSNEDICNNSNL